MASPSASVEAFPRKLNERKNNNSHIILTHKMCENNKLCKKEGSENLQTALVERGF